MRVAVAYHDGVQLAKGLAVADALPCKPKFTQRQQAYRLASPYQQHSNRKLPGHALDISLHSVYKALYALAVNHTSRG